MNIYVRTYIGGIRTRRAKIDAMERKKVPGTYDSYLYTVWYQVLGKLVALLDDHGWVVLFLFIVSLMS